MKKESGRNAFDQYTSTSASVRADQVAVSSEALRNLRAIEDAATEGWARHGGSIRGTRMDVGSVSLLTNGSVSGVSMAQNATAKRRRR